MPRFMVSHLPHLRLPCLRMRRLAPIAALGLAVLGAHGLARAQNAGPPPDYYPGANPGAMPADNPLGDPLGGPVGDPNAAAVGADPSARIATLTDVAGNISFAPAGSDQWAATGLNRPVTTGDRLWVDPGSRAELHAGTTAVRLGGATAVSVLDLDDTSTQIKLTEGTLQLRVRALPQGQSVEIDTPNLAFLPTEPGDYRIDVAPDGSATTVTMRHGHAVLYGDNRSTEMERGERLRFTGTDLEDGGAGNLAPTDAFDRWTAERDAREDRSVAAQYVPRDMTGYTALDGYGDWQQDGDYGAIWFPRAVPAGWAPYSVGHWAWVAPWGWTWIDDQPWGFAPSHYGRWAYVGSRWGWVPGPLNVRPCYAPAVVGFIGGATVGVRIGGGPGVAWYPLGPGERYRPVYRASPAYQTRVNYFPVDRWHGRGDRERWYNHGVPGAITGMPARSFVEGQRSRGMHMDEWRRIPPGERGAPAMAPVKASLFGAAPTRNLPPQARQGFAREVIAARAPGRVAPDELARRFAREGGTAGAGPAWRGAPGPDVRQPGGQNPRQSAYRTPQPVAQPDVRISQAAQRPREGRNAFVARPEQMRGLPDEALRQQQAMQRQRFDQERQLREQQRQQPEFQRQQQQALMRQQLDQQRQLHEQQRQGQDFQRQQQQALQRQQQDQPRAFGQQRQQQDDQRAAMQRAQQDQQRAFEQQRQQQDQQRAAMQRAQMEQQRAAEMQRHQQDQQRAAMQRAQAEQQRAQAMQRQQMEQQREQQRQFQQQQRQAFEQQRQMQEQQRQQQMQQQHSQQQQQQQRQFSRGGQQARNDDRR